MNDMARHPAVLLLLAASLDACQSEVTVRTPPIIEIAPPASLHDAGSPDVGLVAVVPPAPPAPAPEIDVRTQDGAAAFLAAVCTHAARAEDPWVEAHVAPKVRGNVALSGGQHAGAGRPRGA